MSSTTPGVASRASTRPHGPTPPPHDAATAAWLALLPCALVAVAAIVALGPPLGALLFPTTSSATFWPGAPLSPEPTEDARYLIAVGAPVLLALATVWLVRRPPRLPARLVAAAVPAAQAATVAFVVACIAGQHRPLPDLVFSLRDRGVERVDVYFTPATFAVAAALAALLVAATHADRLRAAGARLLRETPRARAAALLVAVTLTAVSVMPAINTDRSFTWSADTYDAAFPLNETYAVLNGRPPLVDFSAQYGSLWPYLSAVVLTVFGKTLLAFTVAQVTITGVALLAVYDALRRAARSSLAALLLYAPFVATGFFIVRGTLDNRFSFGTYFGMFPLRYAGPYLLAGLTAHHLDRSGGRAAWPLFLLAGLVMLNNTDFGVAAFGATVAALVLTTVDWRRATFARLALSIALGLAVAVALVALLTLAVAGSPPQLGRLVEFGRIYGAAGFNVIPMPGVLILPLAIYATYVAAIAVATVRALNGEPNRVLTGMLAWSGVFGLGSATYYVTRSHFDTIQTTFSPWALALALLTVATVRHLASHPSRRPTVAAVAVLFGFGVTVCSLAQTPRPWSEVARLHAPPAGAEIREPEAPMEPIWAAARGIPGTTVRDFVVSLWDADRGFVERPGAPVAILATTGHLLADAYGVVNVSPYSGPDSLNTVEQLDRVLAELRAAGGNTVLVSPYMHDPHLYAALARRGYGIATRDGGVAAAPPDGLIGGVEDRISEGHLTKFVDTRTPHPRALREPGR